ncbi:MAG: hypothetical protein MZW92_39340 [Comamonadaceae bacterium]|nr:hypothetical protein [Comamonadaceae bacterium]
MLPPVAGAGHPADPSCLARCPSSSSCTSITRGTSTPRPMRRSSSCANRCSRNSPTTRR